MNFDFIKLKKHVTKTALKAKEVSGNMVEIAKYKLKLSEIKSDIDDKYIQIGKLVYKGDETSDITEKLEKICDDITELKTIADDIQKSIDENLNRKTCPKCNAKADKECDFCPKCGCELNEQ